MSLIDEQSCECTTSPLEWFEILPTQTSVEKSTHVEYQPVTALTDSSPVEFHIPSTTEDYLDLLNTHLYIKLKVVKDDDSVCADADKIAPINDIFNSLWSNVEVFLNDRLVSHSNNTHGYMSMMKLLAFGTEEALTSQHSMRLVFKDTPGQMDEVDASVANPTSVIPGFNIKADGSAETAVGNHGLHQRYLYTHKSKVVDLIAPLRVDIFEQKKIHT